MSRDDLDLQGKDSFDAAVVDKISGEQARQGRVLAEKWGAVGRSTARANRGLFEEAIGAAYRRIKLKPPEVRWFASPVKGIVPAVFEVIRGSSTITGNLYEKPMQEADQRINFSPDVARAVNESLVNRAGALAALVHRAVAMEMSIRAAVIGDQRQRIGQIIQKLVDRAVPGAHDVGRLVLYDFADLALEIDGLGETHALRGAAQSGVGWYWPFEKVVIATERPSVVRVDAEGKPHSAGRAHAIKYADGFGIYCRQGARIPHEMVTEEGAKWGDIKKTVDKNLQEVLVEDKVEKWGASDKTREVGETDEERREAALAIQRLGGIDAVESLTEAKK